MASGGHYPFDDGGVYDGGWIGGKAHGHGVCTGPKGQGEYSGAWENGFETCGVYRWPNGNYYEGLWENGKRQGLGVERKGRWIYCGEWTKGFKGRYGTRVSTSSGSKYEGTWSTGLQEGYGVETYADRAALVDRGPLPKEQSGQVAPGQYLGQWLRGMRHGYGVRRSVPYGQASHYRPKAVRASLTSIRSEQGEDNVVIDRDRKIDENRGGFVLKAKGDESPTTRRRLLFKEGRTGSLRKNLFPTLKFRKQKSTGDIQDSPRRVKTGSVRSTVSNISHTSGDSSQSGVTSASICTGSNHSFVSQEDIADADITETYRGEWKNDKRSGFGIGERSDGLKYEGEWLNNKKHGYGITTFKDGTKEEGKYKNNVLVTSVKKNKLFLIRPSKTLARVEAAIEAAAKAGSNAEERIQLALQRADNAKAKAQDAYVAAEHARKESEAAHIEAAKWSQQDLPVEGGGAAMDVAIASGSSQIMEGLHRYGDEPSQQQQPKQGKQLGLRQPNHTTHWQEPQGRHPQAAQQRYPPEASHRYPQEASQRYPPEASHRYPQEASQRYPTEASQRYPNETSQRYPPDASQRYPPAEASQRYPPDASQRYPHEASQRYPHEASQRYPPDASQRYPHDASQRHPSSMSDSSLPMNRHPHPPHYDAIQPQQQQQHFQHQKGNRPERFADSLNSRSTPDHFDQYRTRDDSGLGRDLDSRDLESPLSSEGDRSPLFTRGESAPRHGPLSSLPHHGAHYDRSPDSGLSDIDDFRQKSRPLQRRSTLPSIMKGEPPAPTRPAAEPTKMGLRGVVKPVYTAPSHTMGEPTNRYVIENGIRKRVRAEHYTQPSVQPKPKDPLDIPKELPNKFKVEPDNMLQKGANRGSLPDITACKELHDHLMPRSEASSLAEKRRAEIRYMREEAERRKQQEIVLRLTDLKDWCQQRQLLMLVIALNVSLATMFFNILSQ